MVLESLLGGGGELKTRTNWLFTVVILLVWGLWRGRSEGALAASYSSGSRFSVQVQWWLLRCSF